MKRRAFLKTVGGAAGLAALGLPRVLRARDERLKNATVPQRTLGRTGQKLSVVGFPGLALIHYEQERCNAAVREAMEYGVNYFDVAPAYGNGQCETKMGIAFQGIPRDKYFLACKTKKRDREGCQKELDESLRLLKTDHFDLYQLHHLVQPAHSRQAVAPEGAMEAILKAKEQGKIKYIGFSAHTTKAAIEVMNGFKFDTVMFPINFVEYYNRGYGKEVLALAEQQGAAVLAIKPLSWGAWPKDTKRTREWWYSSTESVEDIQLAMRFTLSHKPVVAGIPPSFLDLLDRTIEACQSGIQPLDEAAEAKLRKMAENRGSIFIGEENQVALGRPYWVPVHPDSPHESCEGHLA